MPKQKSTLDELLQAPQGQIRAVLRALCQDTQVRNTALDHLDSLKILYNVESKFLGPTATKRKAEDEVLICVQCDSAFFEKGNDKESCDYHWGECEPDWDSMYWADTDPRCHGPIDTKENRKSFPKGFIWTCCGKTYDELGCAWGMHEADPRKSRRECGHEPSDLDDDEDDDDEDDFDEDFDEEGDQEPDLLNGKKK
ncbi:hypothetical protein NW768_002984 [Fusarium equiseti]|uniref:Uncharacterized protein n=1 Tax=Fusarium equiseti TaxID=61235 RepID=A0ABQ8RKQ7_FUSEQ|nr:hypothetical protein NW768_002984 [Fusarium equiseti]